MIVIGTSGVVQPVASIPIIGKSNGGKIIEINPEVTDLSPISDVHIKAMATVGTSALEKAFLETFSQQVLKYLYKTIELFVIGQSDGMNNGKNMVVPPDHISSSTDRYHTYGIRGC